jgi:hypothetical protein
MHRWVVLIGAAASVTSELIGRMAEAAGRC